MSWYSDQIREHLARGGRIGMDPRHVEAFMRIEHSTLDGLSAAEFKAEVELSAQCVEAAGQEESERAALSFGL